MSKINSQKITKAILYGSWLNNQNPYLQVMFTNTFNMYLKYNKTYRFKLFHLYNDNNFIGTVYKPKLICIGMAKFRHSTEYSDPFYLFSTCGYDHFTGFSCCVKDNYSRYSFDNLSEVSYSECPYIDISSDMIKQFFDNFKFQ